MMGNGVSAVALFSGGLDSILAAKLIMEQGIPVKCLHFISPFFGKAKAVGYWHKLYGLDIEVVDISDDYIRMLRARPRFGFGKVMNPCVDCKILMLRHARNRMVELGASFIISGAVVGQRPMSQRKDAMNIIRREADVRDILLRPLCAKLLDPISVELNGCVDRELLADFRGRGRDCQIALAERMGIRDIPTPAGGCKLCEKENARRYWTVLTRLPEAGPKDFLLADVGRQFWSDHGWLSIGRNAADNERLQQYATKYDIVLKVLGFPGPMALLKTIPDQELTDEEVIAAAEWVGICTPKAVSSADTVDIRIRRDGKQSVISVNPTQNPMFGLPPFDGVRSEIHPSSRG